MIVLLCDGNINEFLKDLKNNKSFDKIRNEIYKNI